MIAPHGDTKELRPVVEKTAEKPSKLPPIKTSRTEKPVFQEPKTVPTKAPEPTKKAETGPEDPTSMSYSDFKLWKHNEKLLKKKAEMMAKQGRELPQDPQPEPEFKTYQEFKA